MSNNSNEVMQDLVGGMKLSQGRFSPFLARYSYVSQRDRLMEELRASFPGVLAELQPKNIRLVRMLALIFNSQ